jgi:ribosomal protein S18 acetylase RimI-like enzyme
MAPTRIQICLWLATRLVAGSAATVCTAFVGIKPCSPETSTTSTTKLNANFPAFFPKSKESNNNNNNNNNNGIPYIIERLPVKPNDETFDEIAAMCIEVFFNVDGSKAPWKALQLAYLRTLQSSDLKYRRSNTNQQNCMVVARRVIPMSSPIVSATTPLILDTSQINNNNNMDTSGTDDWVRGEILGFCEVTERPFGIAAGQKNRGAVNPRPVLTNLSVRADARELGMGGKLVHACEDAVLEWENQNEVLLEVEKDNQKAFEFYKRRGYSILFEDPACRRYNTNGILLGKEMCTKICMRKDLKSKAASRQTETGKSSFNLVNIFNSIRITVFS